MKLDVVLVFFQVAVFFLPGVIWARLDQAWAQREKGTDVEFLIRSFLFGVASYVVTFVGFYLVGAEFEVLNLSAPSLTGRLALEIACATAVGFGLGIVWLYASNHKWLAIVLQTIKATKRYGDEDVWDFTFNSEDRSVAYVHVRDFDQKVVYAGYVNAFSEGGELRELMLRDVIVYDFDGNTMYDVPRLYLAREAKGMHIEFPA